MVSLLKTRELPAGLPAHGNVVRKEYALWLLFDQLCMSMLFRKRLVLRLKETIWTLAIGGGSVGADISSFDLAPEGRRCDGG